MINDVIDDKTSPNPALGAAYTPSIETQVDYLIECKDTGDNPRCIVKTNSLKLAIIVQIFEHCDSV